MPTVKISAPDNECATFKCTAVMFIKRSMWFGTQFFLSFFLNQIICYCHFYYFISFINSCFLCAAACCTLWVSPHHGQQVSDKLHGWCQANTHSHYLHRPAHLEHSALHPAACRLTGQTEPAAGHLTCEFDLDFFACFVCLFTSDVWYVHVFVYSFMHGPLVYVCLT